MSVADEEARANAYRAQLRRREVNEQARSARLAGSPSARRQLQEDWQPLIDQLTDGTLMGDHDDQHQARS